MEIWSIDRDASISLTEWEVDDYGVKVAMAVQNGTFAGANEEVWFFRDRFAAFTQALGAFALEHDGEVHIESMSPGEGVLTIRRLDLARHILVETQVSRLRYLRGHPFYNRVAVAFELDPSQLPDIVRGLAAIISDEKAS